MLYALLISAPRLVGDQLVPASGTGRNTRAWLADTARVRDEVRRRAEGHSLTGTLPRHPVADQVIAEMKARIRAYVEQTTRDGGRLPAQVVRQLRAARMQDFAARVGNPARTDRAQLLALARTHGVPGPQLLTDAQLRTQVAAAYFESDAPLTDEERRGLLSAVRTWNQSWAGGYGDVFLTLAAHALGLAVDVAQWDDTSLSTIVTDRYGPTGGQVVEVHYDHEHQHYRGSDAIPAGPATQSAPETGETPETAGTPEIIETAETTVRLPRPVAPPDAEELMARLAALPGPELPDALALLDPSHRRWLADRADFTTALRSRLPAAEFAEAAARLLVAVLDGTQRPASARREAYSQLTRLLRDPDTALRLLAAGGVVALLPTGLPLGAVEGFTAHRHGTDGRPVDATRGMTALTTLVAAVPEENLLGERTGIAGVGPQPEGYSTAIHELAHLLYEGGLTPGDRALVARRYRELRAAGPDAPWPDGPRRHRDGQERDNYSATDEHEFFAQLTASYLGTNQGTDPRTGRPRNNGAAWVRENEPALLPLLERLYGPDPDAAPGVPVNPLAATAADNARYAAFRDFMAALNDPADSASASGSPYGLRFTPSSTPLLTVPGAPDPRGAEQGPATAPGIPDGGPLDVPPAEEPDDPYAVLRHVVSLPIDELLDYLSTVDQRRLRWLAEQPDLRQSLRADSTARRFAQVAARLLVVVPEGPNGPPRTPRVPLDVHERVALMLADPETAERLLAARATLLVLPDGLPQETEDELRDQAAAAVDSGGTREVPMAVVHRSDLLADWPGPGRRPRGPAQADDAVRDIAWTLYHHGLAEEDRDLVDRRFRELRRAGGDAPWPDGPLHDRDGWPAANSSSHSGAELFAALSSAYLGTNHGTDPETGLPRNNGAGWVREHELLLLPLLQRLYGPEPVPPPPATGTVHIPPPRSPEHPARTLRELGSLEYQELLDRLPLLDHGTRRWLARQPAFVRELRARLTAERFAAVAARLLVGVLDGAGSPASARWTAYTRLERMLKDPAAVEALLLAGGAIMVLPRDLPLDALRGFHFSTRTPRGYRATRGAAAPELALAVVPEENLLGEASPVPWYGTDHDGTSTLVHETAHLLHRSALSDEEQQLIARRFRELRRAGRDAPWPDGPAHDLRGRDAANYSATDEDEFFAQLTMAYLGVNTGTDGTTGQPRNNGPAWVRENEPLLLPLLERLYGPDPDAASAPAANPLRAVAAENERYEAFRQFMTGAAGDAADPTPGHPASADPALADPSAPAVPHSDPDPELSATPLLLAPPRPGGPGGTAPVAVSSTTANGELSGPTPLDRRELAKQAISRPLPGTRHRPPLTAHASEPAARTGRPDRHMVPDAQDLERLHAARTPGDPAYRDGWERLTPSQTWALLAAEQRGELFHERERAAFAARIAHFNRTLGTRYPVHDPAATAEITQAAHDHVRRLPIATNQDLAARPAGGTPRADGTVPTRAEALTADTAFRSFWSTGTTGGTASRPGRGWVEELQGYATALRRTRGTPEDGPNGGEFHPPDPDELPLYAALVSPAQAGGTYSYGSAVLHWKESVRARVTHTPGDSADREERGVLSYTDNAHVFPLLAHGEEQRVRLALAEATGFRHDPELRREIAESGYAAVGRYFETQIHGGLSWQDLDRVVLNWGELHGSARRFTTRAEAEGMAAYLRAFAEESGLGFTVELGREIGEPAGAEAAADRRTARLYGMEEDEVGPRERALSRALDRLAAPAPFPARADEPALLALARAAGITAPDPDDALEQLWRAAERARDLLPDTPHGTEPALTLDLLATPAPAPAPEAAPALTPTPAPDPAPEPARNGDPVPVPALAAVPLPHTDPASVPSPPTGGEPFEEALLAALEAAGAAPLNRDHVVPVADLAGTDVVLSVGQNAQAVLLGGSLTVEELGLTPLQHLRWLLGRPDAGHLRPGADDGPAALWAFAARTLGVPLEVTDPDGRVHLFGSTEEGTTVRLRFDGTRYLVLGGSP
ncbi:hypothetical protein [Streptomyces lichenis]|uniref:Lonely Cys domain-containing protein n=1 Tax=Streptomyces lichenis TaxID=2306967 RepID=A0ABT0IAF2_9ACTN|nr:hypothetical protein [Streptomyces lichenis]MCK8678311.1 hypothetical protein [Streptomyces lichenis]